MGLTKDDFYQLYEKKEKEWFGEVPSHWSVKRVKDEMDNLDFKRVPLSGEVRGEMTKKEYAYYGASGVIDQVESYILNEPTILMGEDGANLLSRNSPLAFIARGKYWVNNHAHILREKRGSLEYFCYLLESLDYTRLVSGAAQPKFTAGQLNRVLLMVPPCLEQKKIATYLNNKTSKIDRYADLLGQKLVFYGKLKQSLINEAVTYGLDKTVSMEDSEVVWLGEVPSKWVITRNKDIFCERGSLSQSGNETLLTVSHITGVTRRSEKNVNMFMAETMEGYKHCKLGDLVINTMWAWMGALGTAREDGICSPAYGVYAPKKGVPYYHRYFDYLYRTPKAISEMTRNSKGIVSSRLRLYPKDFYQILTALPSYDEQVAIANYLDEKTTQIDRIVITIQQQIEKLKELRKTLINDVVTGKIKVVTEEATV